MFWIATEAKHGLIGEMQIDTGFQANRTGHEHTIRHQHATTTGARASVNCLGDCFRRVRAAIVRRAITSDVEVAIRKYRTLNA